MNYVNRPKNIDLMCKTVIPIPDKIRQQEKKYPCKNSCFNIENDKMLMDINKYKKEKPGSKNIQQSFSNTYIEVCHRFSILKKISLSFLNNNILTR